MLQCNAEYYELEAAMLLCTKSVGCMPTFRSIDFYPVQAKLQVTTEEANFLTYHGWRLKQNILGLLKDDYLIEDQCTLSMKHRHDSNLFENPDCNADMTEFKICVIMSFIR